MDTRSQNEILHGKKLAESGNPEAIWNWDSPAGQKRASRRAKLISEGAQLRPASYALEIGCGTGLFTELMSGSGARILAVDISPDLLDLAKARNLPSEQIEFRETRFEDSGLDSTFDAVVGSSVLHHLDIPLALSEIFRLLKPGGWMAFAEPNMLNPQVWMERHIPAIRERLGVSPDETAIVRWQFAKLLEKQGFTSIHIINFDWLHPATPEPMIPLVYGISQILERLPLIREFSGSVLIVAQRPA